MCSSVKCTDHVVLRRALAIGVTSLAVLFMVTVLRRDFHGFSLVYRAVEGVRAVVHQPHLRGALLRVFTTGLFSAPLDGVSPGSSLMSPTDSLAPRPVVMSVRSHRILDFLNRTRADSGTTTERSVAPCLEPSQNLTPLHTHEPRDADPQSDPIQPGSKSLRRLRRKHGTPLDEKRRDDRGRRDAENRAIA
jgi:hypothetical protein